MPDTTWEKAKHNSKAGFDKVWGWADKLGAPVNKLSNKLGAEAFWPTSLDKECDKAARILRSFCKDGFYEEIDERVARNGDGPKAKQKVLKKIPTQVIANAKGLAIFTTMRSGLWISGAGGSGILVARTESGAWSPPSGILLHTAGLGFLVGVDIYDCVVVINTTKALEAFTKVRCTLGGEISAVAGPVGIGGIMETELHKRQAPVWTYLKSRGFYAGVQVDGTVILERTDENERFYHERIPVADILAGKVRHPPYEIKTLMETIKAAQGDRDVDESALPESAPTPGDMEVARRGSGSSFGLPAEGDPDPFGVLALQHEGFEIREAGTGSRPSSAAFEYKPSPTSPIYTSFSRNSVDSSIRRESWRNSKQSLASTDRATQTEDTGTQTLFEEPMQYANNYHPQLSESPNRTINDIHVHKEIHDNVANGSDGPHDDHAHEQETDTETLNEEDVHEAAAAQAAPKRLSFRARLVTIPKRIPPALPPRNPNRGRQSSTDLENGDFNHIPNDGGSSNGSSDYEHRTTSHEIPPASPGVSDRRDMDGFDDVVLDDTDDRTQFPSATTANISTSHNTHIQNDTNAPKQDHDHDYTKSPPLKFNTTGTDPRTDPEISTLPPNHIHNISAEERERDRDLDKGKEEFHSIPTTPSEVISSSRGIPGAW